MSEIEPHLPEAMREPTGDNAPHILVVDDDNRIRQLVMRLLVEGGFRVTGAESAQAARASMRGLTFDLIVLDIMMPGESGIQLARDLKKISATPICMLSATEDYEQRIEGLETGVDDYIAKPFEPRDLVLRLRNIVRRGRGNQTVKDEIRMGEFAFHIARGELKRGEETIRLTERERDLMRLFASRPGIPIPRHELAADDSTGQDRAVDVQINRLRRKIEVDYSNPVYLQTARGKGYILYVD